MERIPFLSREDCVIDIFFFHQWRNGQELKACISLSVLSLQEDGELHRLKKKWWHDRSECGQDKAKVNGLKSAVQHLQRFPLYFFTLTTTTSTAAKVASH